MQPYADSFDGAEGDQEASCLALPHSEFSPPRPVQEHRIFVGGIPYYLSEDQVRVREDERA